MYRFGNSSEYQWEIKHKIFWWRAREARNYLTKSNGGTKIWFEKDPRKSRKTPAQCPTEKGPMT